MDSGWVKLHRKLLHNDAIFRGGSTFPVFCWLLLMADRNGVVTAGRYQISQWLKIRPSTVYLALKRLENMTTIELKPNNKMTTITILNWSEYQAKPNTKVTAKQQQDNTKQEGKNKNKESRIRVSRAKALNTRKTLAVDNRDPQITQLISHFETSIGKMPRGAQQVYAATTLLKQHGFERSVGAINAAAAARGDRYAPSIGSLEELLEKWIKLETYWNRNAKPKGAKIR